MMKTMKIDTPVLFDANILMNFKGQLKFLFGFFDDVMIHRQVYNEVIGQALKSELDALTNIKYVDDYIPTDDVDRILFNECDKELKVSFNLEVKKDLGEYKTLLYAKFNNIMMLSSQDTTVWKFVTDSKYFKGIECITMQDISYLLYLNSKNKRDRSSAKSLYEEKGRAEHPFECFKLHMQRNGNAIPQYISFENNRIENLKELVNSYIEAYGVDSYVEKQDVENDISNFARNNVGNCISCLYSRVDKNRLDYILRTCKFNYTLNDASCNNVKEEFTQRIRTREKQLPDQ